MTDNPYEIQIPDEPPGRGKRGRFKTSTLVGMVLAFVAFVGMGMMVLSVQKAPSKVRVRQPPTKPVPEVPAEKPAEVEPEPQAASTAKCIHIVDGDTIDVLTGDKETIRIRLFGVDCPEGGQPFGKNAKQFVSDFCGGKMVRLDVEDTDRYGRTVAEVFVGEQSLCVELVKAGLAWHYVKYAPDREDFAEAEKGAREAVLGLWAGSHEPIAPWEWRKLSKVERDKLR